MAPALGADLGSAVVKSATGLGRDIAVQPLLHRNVELGIRDVEAWLRGIGAARINNEMAGVATAEIRARRRGSGCTTRCGCPRESVDALMRRVLEEELSRVRDALRKRLRRRPVHGPGGLRAGRARRRASASFLTLPTYWLLD
jgi:hypothetical protein